jgi:hypothetical protein
MKLKITGLMVGFALLGSLPVQADTALCKAGSVITDQTVDCKGAYISGGWCEGDSDDQGPIITLRNATIKNAKFAQGKAGKGIFCESGTCNVEGVVFDEVCEDAVSTRKDGVTVNIKGSTFKNTLSNAHAYGKKPDKFIQVNYKNVKVNISDSEFHIVDATSSTPDKITSAAGKIARTCGNCTGNAGPRTITMTNVKAYGKFDSIVGVNSKYRDQSSSMRDTVTIKGLKVQNYSISGDKSTPPVCVEYEGLDKAKHSGDSPKIGQAWETASCVVKKSDVSKL